MTDEELRALVRDAVARHLSGTTGTTGTTGRTGTAGLPIVALAEVGHPSHAVYLSIVNTGGECVIEPSVPCNHCNYCKSHGH